MVLGYSVWASVIYATALCQAEMVTLLPLDGSFIRLAGRFVDESYGMAAGYNCECLFKTEPEQTFRDRSVIIESDTPLVYL